MSYTDSVQLKNIMRSYIPALFIAARKQKKTRKQKRKEKKSTFDELLECCQLTVHSFLSLLLCCMSSQLYFLSSFRLHSKEESLVIR